MVLAPIAIFAYNRPTHIKRLLESLMTNPEFLDSPVSIYCDGPKTKADQLLVNQTRDVIKTTLAKGNKVNIIERDKNLGLSISIIKGVSEQCKEYGRVIVLEDDLIASSALLKYFNTALECYQTHEQVLHISAYTLPIKASLPASYFSREMSCWGWATWKRAWDQFEPDANKLAISIFKKRLTRKFNVDNSYGHWELLLKEIKGLVDSWDIRWQASIFINQGLILYPGKSLVQNIGFDGSGVHCGVSTEYDTDLSHSVPPLPTLIQEEMNVRKLIIRHRNRTLLEAIYKNIVHYYKVIKFFLRRA
ncbi:MAG: glycosyltransferase family 2 protein [Endozoicomonadaceae bacterium]|nr:glycosyltransferase family 2 protein [Endozoicomonadaceae bacterium]